MRQHGLLTRSQAMERGMSDGQIRLRLKSGRFVRLRHGVYRVQGAPSTWEQTLLAACLSTGGVVSHHTACRLHESAAVASDQLTITVQRGHKKVSPEGIHLHRTRSLAADETMERRRIPVTSPLRTLSDMATVLDDTQLLELATDFLGRRIVAADQLRKYVTTGGAASERRYVGKLREVVRRLLEDGPYESAAETRLHQLLLRAAIPDPVRQLSVCDRQGKLIGRLDFAWPDRLVNLEMDGFGFHSSPEAFHENRRRDVRLARLGWQVLRTSPAELDAGATELLASLRDVLGAREAATH
jgi:predicted transcriptional regulator of viral defense system